MPDRFDVVVAGGGPVGAAAALALRETGVSVALVEPRRPRDPTSAAAPFRPIALSHASRLLLERGGVFGALPVTAIETVHISQAGGFGRAVIRAAELGVPALGYVTDLAPLAEALLAAAAPEHIAARVKSWEERADGVKVRLGGDAPPEIETKLLVLADGGHLAADDLSLRDYGQTAIVARVRPERIEMGTAFERFTAQGPVALLPCDDRYALIWSMRTNRARDLRDAADAGFLATLKTVFGRGFGDFLEVGTRVSYPLVLRFRRATAASPRIVAIGNAAQTLHPVAGQGLNLGLRDAAELAGEILGAGGSALDAGEFALRFAARRRRDRYASIGITEGLVRAFGSDRAFARALRGAGLLALDLVPPARKLLARRFVFGLRALP
jgi:2-octaprenyl-6-methoxyphenol hydroxylase